MVVRLLEAMAQSRTVRMVQWCTKSVLQCCTQDISSRNRGLVTRLLVKERRQSTVQEIAAVGTGDLVSSSIVLASS